MNILITSVGRRAYLVDYFKQELNPMGGKVYVGNSTEFSTAFNHADGYVKTPLIYAENYIPFLLEYCKEKNIEAILSVFDIDLPILSKNKDKFRDIGCSVVVSDYEFVSICNDKWKTYKYLLENGFSVPKTYNKYSQVLESIEKKEICFPIIVKPRFGMGSLGIRIAYDIDDLCFYYKDCLRKIETTYLNYESKEENDKVIFQEYLNGQEYGVDIINNLFGVNKTSIIKRKIAMRSGETDIAVIEENDVLMVEANKLGKITKHVGNLDTDWFLVDNKPYILEMNARFGGGYPFSHAAGVNLPKAIVNWLQKKEIDDSYLTATPGICCAKEIQVIRI